MRHTLRETWSGLKRNMAMTVAVIVTMSVSLSLFGLGLLTSMEVDLVKDRWYDKVEISVFLCVERSTGGRCEAGKATTDAQREAIKSALQANPEVQEVFYGIAGRGLRGIQASLQGLADTRVSHCRPDAGLIPGQAEEPRELQGSRQ